MMIMTITKRSLLWCVCTLLLCSLPLRPCIAEETIEEAVTVSNHPSENSNRVTSTENQPRSQSQPQSQPTAAFLHIAEDIDPWQAAYIKRAIASAVEAKVDYIITHVDTYGGRVDSAIEILNSYLEMEGPDKPICVAYVSSKAISAGALIAYGHHQIYMSNRATIGDIGVIYQNKDGEMKYAPEKSQTVIRAELTKASSIRGWDHAWLQKMTARNQKLYLVRHTDGDEEYVIQDDLEIFLADNPDIDAEDKKQLIVILGEDRFVTQSVENAIKYNIATGKAQSIEEVYALLNINPDQIINLTPTDTENMARALQSWASIFLGLTILFIIFEMKTAGVGVFAILACVTGALFGICQYYQDLASYWELVCILLGLALIAVELFTLASGGILAVVGGGLMLVGMFMSFMPESGQFDFDNPFYAEQAGKAVWESSIALAIMLAGTIALITFAPKIPALRRLVAEGAISGTGASAEETSGIHIGKTGVVVGELVPSGQVDLGDGIPRSAKSKFSNALNVGQKIHVVGHEFGDLIVQVIEAPDSDKNTPTETEQATDEGNI